MATRASHLVAAAIPCNPESAGRAFDGAKECRGAVERDGMYGGSAFIYSPIGGMFVEGRRLSERNAYPAIEIEDI